MKKLFIVGMPRSGTKLLRDLCNGHSNVDLLKMETHFLPFLINKFGSPEQDAFADEHNEAIFQQLIASPFHWNMKEDGKNPPHEELKSAIRTQRWSKLFESIMNLYGEEAKKSKTIIGDKTPGYINHIDLIKRLYPDAKILVLVRDPRDYVLSVKKTWGKNIFRAAHVWNHTMKRCLRTTDQYQGDIHYVQYEELLDEPEKTLMSICEFLDINFESGMLNLERSMENYGDAKGQKKILKGNHGKYKEQLSEKDIRTLEEITFESSTKWYQPAYAARERKLTSGQLKWYKLKDGFNSARFHVRDKGMMEGLSYFIKLNKVSSWR